MHRSPPLPPELWAQIPAPAQAALWMIIDGYERRIVRLEREVAEVREQLRRNSQNSSKPPSSDGPHVKRKPPKEPSGRKPGGQPGHPVHRRTLMPVEQVSEVWPWYSRRRSSPASAMPVLHSSLFVLLFFW